VLTVAGGYTQNSMGELNISVGGSTTGKFGKVAVSNGVSPCAPLSGRLINGLVPVIGETFSILTGSAVSDQFATVKGLSINSSEHFEVAYSANRDHAHGGLRMVVSGDSSSSRSCSKIDSHKCRSRLPSYP
jgi:hypothetical protein